MTNNELAKKLLSGQTCRNCSWALKNVVVGFVYLCANSKVNESIENLETHTCELWMNKKISL